MGQVFKATQPAGGSRRMAWVEACDIQGAGCPSRGHIWNLSSGGAYLVADPIPPNGQTLQISFGLPDGTRFEGEARVAWRNEPSLWKGCGAQAWTLPPGCGLEFMAPLQHAGSPRRSA